jgi:hypothetical protein
MTKFNFTIEVVDDPMLTGAFATMSTKLTPEGADIHLHIDQKLWTRLPFNDRARLMHHEFSHAVQTVLNTDEDARVEGLLRDTGSWPEGLLRDMGVRAPKSSAVKAFAEPRGWPVVDYPVVGIFDTSNTLSDEFIEEAAREANAIMAHENMVRDRFDGVPNLELIAMREHEAKAGNMLVARAIDVELARRGA